MGFALYLSRVRSSEVLDGSPYATRLDLCADVGWNILPFGVRCDLELDAVLTGSRADDLSKPLCVRKLRHPGWREAPRARQPTNTCRGAIDVFELLGIGHGGRDVQEA